MLENKDKSKSGMTENGKDNYGNIISMYYSKYDPKIWKSFKETKSQCTEGIIFCNGKEHRVDWSGYDTPLKERFKLSVPYSGNRGKCDGKHGKL